MIPADRHQPGFFTDAEHVVAPLRAALRELVSETFGPSSRPADLPLNPTLRSRITRGIESDHLPSTLYHLPGPDGLRRVVQILQRSGGSREAISRCRRLIDDYEQFLRRENVSRDGLHAMVGDLAPEAHASVVRSNAQAVHKAMTNLIGYGAEVMLATIILLPGSTPGRVNVAQIRGFETLQRIRTDAWFMTSGYARTVGDAPQPRTLDGRPLTGSTTPPATLLADYCSKPLPRFVTRHVGRRQVYQLDEHEIGERSASTFYFGELVPDGYPDPPAPVAADHETAESPPSSEPPPHESPPQDRPSARRRAMISAIIATPARRLHFDVLVHRDVWPHARAELDTFRVVPHGPVDEFTLDDRRTDRIDLGANVQQFSAADHTFSATRLERYGPMVRDALHQLNARPEDFRVYRCETVYPLCDTQFALRFEQE